MKKIQAAKMSYSSTIWELFHYRKVCKYSTKHKKRQIIPHGRSWVVIHRSGINISCFLHVLGFGRGLPPINEDQKKKNKEKKLNTNSHFSSTMIEDAR